MSTRMPAWATMRAEDVRRLLPREEWGPWARASGQCVASDPIEDTVPTGFHPTEEPFFFHCAAHMEGCRRVRKPPKPWAARDQGLCILCGEPAELGSLTTNIVACVEAERRGTTAAWILNSRHCAKCNPNNPDNFPRCRGRACRETGRERRVQRGGCCGITRTGQRRHCAECCAAARANLSARVMPPVTREAAAAARRTKGTARREQIRDLRRDVLANKAIADQLRINVRTVQRALRGAGDVATHQT